MDEMSTTSLWNAEWTATYWMEICARGNNESFLFDYDGTDPFETSSGFTTLEERTRIFSEIQAQLLWWYGEE